MGLLTFCAITFAETASKLKLLAIRNWELLDVSVNVFAVHRVKANLKIGGASAPCAHLNESR